MFETSSTVSTVTCLPKNNTFKMLPEQVQTKVCYDSRLAESFGINEAIILSRMIWSIEDHRYSGNIEFFHDDQWWMYDTMPAFMEYSKLGRKQVLNALANLAKQGIIEKGQYDKQFAVRRNWYTVNIDAIYFATQMSCPIVPKRDYVSSPKGTLYSPKRKLRIVPKRVNTSLSTKNPPENVSNNQTDFSPQPPKGEIGSGEGSFEDILKSIEGGKGKETIPPKIRKTIPPVPPKKKPRETLVPRFKHDENEPPLPYCDPAKNICNCTTSPDQTCSSIAF